MLKDKYKELEKLEQELVEEDFTSNRENLQLFTELLNSKEEIRSNKKQYKIKRKDYWFRFKLFLWKVYHMFFSA